MSIDDQSNQFQTNIQLPNWA